MNTTQQQARPVQQQAAGLFFAVAMTVAMLASANVLATAPAAGHAALLAQHTSAVTPA
jgi:hypothetical protein